MVPLKKKMLMTQRGGIPTVRSGSFESGNDGWTLRGMVRSNLNNMNNGPRTGAWYMAARRNNIDLDAMEYALSKQQAARLRVSLSIYGAALEGASYRISVSFDERMTFTTIATGNLTEGRTYQRVQAQFDVADTGAIIRIAADGLFASFDDWSIASARI